MIRLTKLVTVFSCHFLISVIVALPLPSLAATIERHDDAVMGCAVRVSGLIIDGDADRLRRTLEVVDPRQADLPQRWNLGNHGFRICLDSPGGSLREGIRMARVIQEMYFGTAISADAKCESACAIAFMAGMQMSANDYEGHRSLVDRVLHPQGTLGFHAPDLMVERGQYTEQAIGRAYAVALESVSELLDLIEETRIEFPQTLLREMLATPPDSMLRIERVEQALEWGIMVAPTRFSGLPILTAFETLCGRWGVEQRDPTNVLSHARSTFTDERAERHDPSISIRFEMEYGFGLEAAEPCELFFTLSTSDEYPRGQMSGRLLSEFTSGNITPAFATFPGSTLLIDLPAPDFSADLAFIEQFAIQQEQRADFGSCWLTTPSARVTNVNEYVNLRRQADFSAPVIRQVPLGERVRAQRADNITIIGQERERQSCINACRAFGANREDRTARDRAQQCINDNMLWYEITDARGNRGWVSRKFLDEVN